MFKVGVHHRGIDTRGLEHRIRVGGTDAVGNHHPFEHLVFVARIARDPPGGQLTMAVEEVPEKFKTLKIPCLGQQSAVMLVDALVLHIVGFRTEIIVVAHAIHAGIVGDDLTAINGGDLGSLKDIAIEHAPEHHAFEIGGGSGHIVVSHDTAGVGGGTHG